MSPEPAPTIDPPARSIVLRSAAAALRRALGPYAWCALECLTARATDTDGGTVATASVRAIADDLGVAKNTAHRALAVLASAGLVTAEQPRTDDGSFGPGRYRLHVDGVVAVDTPVPARGTSTPAAPPATSRPRSRATRPATKADQLTLLEA